MPCPACLSIRSGLVAWLFGHLTPCVCLCNCVCVCARAHAHRCPITRLAVATMLYQWELVNGAWALKPEPQGPTVIIPSWARQTLPAPWVVGGDPLPLDLLVELQLTQHPGHCMRSWGPLRP